jgi:hypothetical protein
MSRGAVVAVASAAATSADPHHKDSGAAEGEISGMKRVASAHESSSFKDLEGRQRTISNELNEESRVQKIPPARAFSAHAWDALASHTKWD